MVKIKRMEENISLYAALKRIMNEFNIRDKRKESEIVREFIKFIKNINKYVEI